MVNLWSALALPTAADAVAAGYRQVTQYLPGIGAHYLNLAHLDGVVDPAKPEVLLYGSNAADAPVVGVSYLVAAAENAQPAGLAGPNDGWHFHPFLCWVAGMVVPVGEPVGDTCARIGGEKIIGLGNTPTWMMHAWAVPGGESPWGTFSSENPELTLAVGQTY